MHKYGNYGRNAGSITAVALQLKHFSLTSTGRMCPPVLKLKV